MCPCPCSKKNTINPLCWIPLRLLMTSSPQWRASTPPKEPVWTWTQCGQLACRKSAAPSMSVLPFCYHTSNSSEVFKCIGQYWSILVNIGQHSSTCITSSFANRKFRAPSCATAGPPATWDVRRGLPTVIHSSGHLRCEFGAVDIELQDLGAPSMSSGSGLWNKNQSNQLKPDWSNPSRTLLGFLPSLFPTHVISLKHPQGLSQQALLLLCIIVKLHWKVRETHLAGLRELRWCMLDTIGGCVRKCGTTL